MLRFFKKKSRSKATQNGNKLLTQEEKAVLKEAHELAFLAAEAAKEEAAVKIRQARDRSTKTLTDKTEESIEKNGTGKIFKDILSGKFLTSDGITSHIPYLLFVTSLFLAYISLGYKFENIEREKKRTERALEEVTSEYKTLRSELESRLQQSRVESATADLGLQQPKSPPTLLKLDAK
jgi:hypothetical protein